MEGLVGDVWKGRYWSCDGSVQFFTRWESDAFALSILKTPQQTEPTHIQRDWRCVSAGEVEGDDSNRRHYVVDLVNQADPVRIKLHTVLDGTPVITLVGNM